MLGSGLGRLVDGIKDPVSVEFGELPGFPRTGVTGHAGRFILGRMAGVEVLVQSGRFHFYEGHAPAVVAAPVRTAAELGVRDLILTCAAGGVDDALDPGAIVLIDDHLDLLSRSALAGPVRAGEARFPDMSQPYDGHLAELALEVARAARIPLRRGVYAAVCGPSYETAAEIRMLRFLGADVVGMSMVPEVLAARSAGLRCLGLSLVTNKGTGLSAASLSHEEVVETGRVAGGAMAILVEGIVGRLGPAHSTAAK